MKYPTLYFSYDGLTDPLGQSQVLPYVCGLSEKFDITVVSFEKRNLFRDKQQIVQTICNEHNIRWVPLPYHKQPPVLSTLFDLWRLSRVASTLQKKSNFRIIHCRSYVVSLVGLWMKRKYGIRFIFDMRGFWADERVEGGIWNIRNPIFRTVYLFFKKKEKSFLLEADHVISLTENACREIKSRMLLEIPISVIPTCVDLNLFDPDKIPPKEKEDKMLELGIRPDHYVLTYLGSWGSTWYNSQGVLDFFSAFKQARRDSRLLIISNDHVPLDDFQFKSDVILIAASRKEVPILLSISNASICFIKPTYSKIASSATKMAEAWAMKVPVVTNSGWGDVDILQKQYFPILICDKKSDYEPTINALLNYPEFNVHSQMEYFDLKNAVTRIENIYTFLLKE